MRVLWIAALVAACKGKTTRYELTGEVVQRNPATSEITVKHNEIPGLMPAMTMPYKVSSPLMAAIVEPGDKIAADVITDFVSGMDRIQLDASAMGALGAAGPMSADDSRFSEGPYSYRGTETVIFYNTTTGASLPELATVLQDADISLFRK